LSSESAAFDSGLLSPLSFGHDAVVSDDAVVDALVTAEVALVRGLAAVGAATPDVADEVSRALGWQEGAGCRSHGVDASRLAAAAVGGGNPVIPLVGVLRERVPEPDRPWIHRGATSQDVLDTALMLIARTALERITPDLERAADVLARLAAEHRDTPAAARTLTQHAVPTTVGARAAGWVRGIRRAASRLSDIREQLPVQIGGAAGTLAATADEFGADTAAALPGAVADELRLRTPDAPWHTERWPVTELADALVQVVGALGKLATDVATLSRTEIAELAEGAGGGSSAMPQKQNPVSSVLLRSAALRAPQLGATLHLAAALAADERPDGAWHAEWPTLRELLRLTLGAAAHAVALAEGLRVDREAVARNLALTGGLLVSERLARVLVPRIGTDRFAALIANGTGDDLAATLRAVPEAADLDIAELLDPAAYTGLAGTFADAAVPEDRR
jgi:3-carboxy-cis,cis-muconate cycloisomerase